MMLLTGGQASADSGTAGQCGSVGAVQGGDRAHGGGAVQGRAAGERPAAGERNLHESVGLCVLRPFKLMLRNILVHDVKNSHNSFCICQHKVSLWLDCKWRARWCVWFGCGKEGTDALL